MREAKTWTLIVFQIRSKVLVYFDSEKATVPLKTSMGKPVFPKLDYIDLLSSHCSLSKAGLQQTVKLEISSHNQPQTSMELRTEDKS